LNKIFVVVVLLFATISLFKGVPRYQPVGPELLRNNNFDMGFEGWAKRGGEGAINMASGVLIHRGSARGLNQSMDSECEAN